MLLFKRHLEVVLLYLLLFQAEIDNAKVDEMDQQQSLSDDAAADSAQNVGLIKNAANKEDPKVAYASDMWTGASGSLTEPAQTSRDVED
ncbi:hypothetical protein Tco_1571849 [Tanacetum coccineum]